MNKWTMDTKELAIKLLKQGENKSEIASIVGMSESSVSLLKQTEVTPPKDTVSCFVCGKRFRAITHKHLKRHGMTFDDYVKKFPDAKTSSEETSLCRKDFEHPNRGKTYEEIYGKKEATAKRAKISKKQIGRVAPKMAGRGLTGTRRDTGTFARSTYEANVDRIAHLRNKKLVGEFDEMTPRFYLKRTSGETISYQPDRLDCHGLFTKGAFLEVKGYMYPKDWEKICLFREQNPDLKLLVISPCKNYADVRYDQLESEYKKKIPLWEDEYQNYKTRPDLYQIGYKTPKHIQYLLETYPANIHVSITDNHQKFIASKVVSFCKIKFGKEVYIESLRLIAISNKRKGASKKSSGRFNYELWRVESSLNEIFFVTNQNKTNVFYCYQSTEKTKLMDFFDNNINMVLKAGCKNEQWSDQISEDLLQNCGEDKLFLLQKLGNVVSHRGLHIIITKIVLIRQASSKRGAFKNYKEYLVYGKSLEQDCAEHPVCLLSNFGKSTLEFRCIFGDEFERILPC